MPDFQHYSHEQWLLLIEKKDATILKLKTRLSEVHVLVKEAKTRIQELTSERDSLTIQRDSRRQECQQLQTELQALQKSNQQAAASAEANHRRALRLESELKAQQQRCAALQADKKQAEAATAGSEIQQQKQAQDMAALRKELTALQATLATVQQQQQADHQTINQLKDGKAQQRLAVEAAGAQACTDYSAAHTAVVDFQHRLEVLEAAHTTKDGQQMQSMLSTQDRSGDTNDDRNLQSDVAHIFQRLSACEQNHRVISQTINSWRAAFSIVGNPSVTGQAQDASEQMQISPMGAEGSNVMPQQAAQADATDNRKDAVHSNLLLHVRRDGTPHAGSTAGDGEDVACQDTLGGGSDCLSDVIGTSGSLMQPVLAHAQAPLRLRPPHAIDNSNRAINHLHSKIIAEQAAADSPKATSPKRKAIALEPGPVQPSQGRKRRRQTTRAEEQQAVQQQRHPTQTNPPAEPAHQQQQQQSPAKQSCSRAFLTRFGIEQPDATVVDFLESQLGRITHAQDNSEDEDMAETVSLVAQDIHTAWNLHECPLECIMAQFVTSITTCAAPPPSHQPDSACLHIDPGQREPTPDGEGSDTACHIEDKPLAKLWCSPAARKHHVLTWLLHCANQLDTLLSRDLQPAPAAAATTETVTESASDPAVAPATLQGPSAPPTKKKRGRPFGSKNKKTLEKLQAAGLQPPALSPAGSHQPPKQQQQQRRAGTGKAAQQSTDGVPQQLEQLGFLTGLHKQVLQALGQACAPKRSGLFEAEMCCLSAAAALLCGVMGKVQPVIAQLVEVVRSCELPARSKLQCAAAALEQNPDALATSLPNQATKTKLSLMDSCCHAALQSLSQQAFQERRPADSPGQASTEAGELVTGVSGRIALAVQSWNHNKLTQTAASQLHALYHQQWEQLQQNNSDGGDAPAASEQAQEAGKLWPMAEAALLTQLRTLGMVTGEMDESSVQPLWHDLQTALDIAVVHVGWEWAYYAVLGDTIAAVLAGLLQPPPEAAAHAVSVLKQVLQCMRRITDLMASTCTAEPHLLTSALQCLATNLKCAAEQPELQQQAGMQELLVTAADELLRAKIGSTVAGTTQPERSSGPSKYADLDVEMEEI